jgi:hypothetical protein
MIKGALPLTPLKKLSKKKFLKNLQKPLYIDFFEKHFLQNKQSIDFHIFSHTPIPKAPERGYGVRDPQKIRKGP